MSSQNTRNPARELGTQLGRSEGDPSLSPVSVTLALLQVEVTRAYLAKQVDEMSLQQADVVLVLEQEDGE